MKVFTNGSREDARGETRNETVLPGVAGHAGADDRVEHSEGEEPPMEQAVHPLVRENVGRVADG